MPFSPQRRPLFIGGSIVLLTIAACIPITSVASPECNLTLVDQNNAPLSGISVTRSVSCPWEYAAVESAVTSDTAGRCHFPERTVSLSTLGRSKGFLISLIPHIGGFIPSIADIHIMSGPRIYDRVELGNESISPFSYSESGQTVLRLDERFMNNWSHPHSYKIVFR